MVLIYFKSVTNINELKTEFKRLAKRNHPDCGGSVEVMSAINAEYEYMLNLWRTSGSFSRATINNWWEPKPKAKRELSEVATIAKAVRQFIRKNYPDFKFSIRALTRTCDLKITLLEGKRIFIDGENPLLRPLSNASNWYAMETVTPEALEMIDAINKCVRSYQKANVNDYGYLHIPNIWYDGVQISWDYKERR